MKILVQIISDINKSLAFEWIATGLDKTKYDLRFIILNSGDSEMEKFLNEKNITVKRVVCNGKKDWLSAWWKLYKILREWKPDIVHCHLQTASILGLSAAKRAGIPRRIYTRHHSSLHHIYHPKGVFWDKFCNKRATEIIAISGEVKKILKEWEKVPEEKITQVPHGFDLNVFENVSPERIQAIKNKYSLTEKNKVIGVISRFTEWKGVQFIIPAFRSLLKKYPDAVLMMLNAKGDYKKEIEKLLSTIPASNYRVIDFEKDIAAVYKTFDVFVHVPIDEHSEAFGQTYVESLAAGVPSVFTMSGIAPDFVVDGQNALVVPFKNSNAIEKVVDKIFSSKELAEQLTSNGAESVKEKFTISSMIGKLEKMYDSNIKFTIVVPTYNRAHLISETLDSLQKQQYDNFEVVIVDDGSTDNTEEVVTGIINGKIRYFKKENAERAVARNFGIKKATGDYITFLDSDDILYPGALKIASQAISIKNYPDFLHVGYEIGTKDRIMKRINGLKDNDPIILRDGNPLSCMGVFIKKEVTGNYMFTEDRQLTGTEDWEYWLRLAANYGLRTDNHIIGRLIEHDSRSVINFTEEQLLKRKELSFHYAFQDKAVQKLYAPYRKRMEAFWNIYIALHLAISKKKSLAVKYLAKSFFGFPGVIFKRRFYSVIKKIVLY